MKRPLLAIGLILFCASFFLTATAQDAEFKAAQQKYDEAFKSKDVETVKSLLAPDILLYEHSVRNDGLQDAFENHLKPEILEFKDLQLDYLDPRLTAGADLALVTRQYRVRGQLGERVIDSTGNETIVWKKVAGSWKVAHIHYSHACPRPPAPKQ